VAIFRRSSSSPKSTQTAVKMAFSDLAKLTAEALMAVAIEAQTEHMRRLNVSNPPPHLDSSKPGEYPRKRTGFLQANTLFDPLNLAEIIANQWVDVGVGQNAMYGVWLVDIGKRLGIEDTVRDILPQLEATFNRVMSGIGKRSQGVA
jgi:hypothetical protein